MFLPNAGALDTNSLHLGHKNGLISHEIRMVVCALIFATRYATEIPEVQLPSKALVLHSSKILLKNTGNKALLAVDFYCLTMGLPVFRGTRDDTVVYDHQYRTNQTARNLCNEH